MNVTGVRGDLLRWAREQQGLTMRWIHAHGGPSPGYQSEVENGKKREVLTQTLAVWMQLLGVSEPFARGQLAKFHEDPTACRGLAADVGLAITASPIEMWQGMTQTQRVREVLKRIIHESRTLPGVVLAWVLGLELETVHALLAGEHPILAPHVRAVLDMTAIPDTFFNLGQMKSEEPMLQSYLPAVRLAASRGISPHQLYDLVGCVHTIACNVNSASARDQRRYNWHGDNF